MAPVDGVKEAIDKFYDVDGDFYLSIEAFADIKEWESLGKGPDDLLFGWQVYKNALYLFQIADTRAYVKVLTPNHTYIYDIGPIYIFEWNNMKTSYGKFEVLDEDIVLYGNLYIDLANLMVFLLNTPPENDFNIGLRGFLPVVRSVKSLNSSTWVIGDVKKDGNWFKQVVYLYQRTSMVDCITCDQRKEIFKAIGAEDRAEGIDCSQEEAVNVLAYDFSKPDFFNKKTRTSKLKTLSKSQTLSDDLSDIKVDTDLTECLDAYRKMTALLKSQTIKSDVENFYRKLNKSCSPEFLKILPDYVIGFYKAESLHNDFIKKYYEDKSSVDYDDFFAKVDEIAVNLILVVYGIVKLSSDTDKAIKALKKLFQYSPVWGILYFKLYKNKYKNSNGTWKQVNPYSDLSKVDFDEFYEVVIKLIAGMNLDLPMPVPIRQIKLSKKDRFSEDAVFYSLGPAGCISRIEFTDFPLQTFDNIVDIEIIDKNKLILWTWVDVNGWKNQDNSYLQNNLFHPEYVIRLIELNIDTRKAKVVHEESLPKGWHFLDKRKIAVMFDSDNKYLYLREYYISEYKDNTVKKIDYIEMRRTLTKEMKKLLDSTRSVFVAANLNNVVYQSGRRFHYQSSPGFPYVLGGPKDLGDKSLNLLYPVEWELMFNG